MGKASRARRELRTGESFGYEAQGVSWGAASAAAEMVVVASRQEVALAKLAETLEIRARADRDARTLVNALRAAGVSWTLIGRAANVTRQGAMRRYSSPK